MLHSDTDFNLSSTTTPLFEVSEIYVALESKRSNSSLLDWRAYNTTCNYNERAFVSGGKDDILKAVFINSDIPTPEVLEKKSNQTPSSFDGGEFCIERKDIKRRDGTCCANCSCTQTTLWRRISGQLMCNPCALYFKLHGCVRPRELLKPEIKRRRRKSQNNIYALSNIE